MATKETKNPMNTTEAELKAIARSVGASLSRQGHQVPHSNVLHAVAAALNKRDWHKLKAAVDQTAALSSAPLSTESSAKTALDDLVLAGPAVTARFYTDDRTFEFEFDCRAYLNQATAAQLEAIVAVGFSGDYCTDAIADEAPRFASYGVADSFKEAWDYLSAINRSRVRDSMGYEVSVNGREMLLWLDQQRRDVLAAILCARHDVLVTPDPALPGYWTWAGTNAYDQTVQSTTSLTSESAAKCDALSELELLAQELQQTF